MGDYGSLGAYTFSGTSSKLPIRSVVLNGSSTKGNHLQSWTIKADDAIKNIVIEFSSNGVNFTPLPSLTGISNKFSYKSY